MKKSYFTFNVLRELLYIHMSAIKIFEELGTKIMKNYKILQDFSLYS